MPQSSLMSACFMHSSAQALHIIVVAWSIDIMLSMCMPFGRIIDRIMVLVMSAVFMHMPEHMAMFSPIIIDPAHIVHACSQAEHASIHSSIIAMSMPDAGIVLA